MVQLSVYDLVVWAAAGAWRSCNGVYFYFERRVLLYMCFLYRIRYMYSMYIGMSSSVRAFGVCPVTCPRLCVCVC
jgi:hypothetical protein